MTRTITINHVLLLLLIFAGGCVSQVASQHAIIERPDYGLNKTIFESLPSFPEDFYSVDSRVSSLADLQGFKDITENYYKQPEFYPTWESSGLGGFRSQQDRIGILGIGAYPSDTTISMERNSEINVTVFFHSSWLVQTYQGMSLDIINPDPEYFNISLDRNELLIGPNYPKFDSKWAQKVTARIKSVANTGSYVIGINPSALPEEKSAEWAKKYQPYINFFGGLDRPYVRIVVNIA